MTNYNFKNAKKVFKQANGFFLFVDGMSFKKGDILYLNPYYINCLFACELYLKTILMLNGLSTRDIKACSHDMKSLFEAMTKEEQLDIKHILTIEIQEDVLTYLDKIKDDFINMRYVYINGTNYDEVDINNKFSKCIQLMYSLQHYVSMKLFGRDTYEDVKKNVSI